MKKSSKLLSIVLCIAMVLSLFAGLSVTAVTSEADGDVYTDGSVTDSNVGTSSDTEDPDTEDPDTEDSDAEDTVETDLEIRSLTATSDAAYWDYYASNAVAGMDYIEADGSYTINTALGLAYLAGVVNSGNELSGKTVTLAANIDLSGYYWVPVGQLKLLDNETKSIDSVNTHPFRGTFDGDGHYIDGMTIGGDEYSIGTGFSSEGNALFGMNYGTIKNVGVTNVNVTTYRRGAGIAGMNYGTVTQCMSSGSISANGGGSTRGTGGIVGSNYGLVSYCYSAANVYNSYRRAGGIVGYNSIDGGYIGVIDHCFFTGYAESVNATFSGSIACTNDPGCTVTNCYYLINSAKDAQDNGCAAGYASGAQAYEFNTYGELTDGSGKDVLAEINDGSASGAFIAYQDMPFPVLNWETKYHHNINRVPTLTIKSASGVFADITLSLEQLKTFKESKTSFIKKGTSDGDTGYGITGYTGTGGSVLADKSSAESGETVTLTVYPESGYLLTSLSVTGTSINESVYLTRKTYSFVMPENNVAITAVFEECALAVYSQNGSAGTPELVTAFSKSDLKNMQVSNPSGYAYVFYQNEGEVTRAVVATELVSLEQLLSEAGISGYWRSGSYFAFATSPNNTPYGYSPTYEEIRQCTYYFDEGGSFSQVPCGIAISYNSGNLIDNINGNTQTVEEIAQSAYDSGHLRFVYGISEQQYWEKSAMGMRSPQQVVSMTLIYNGTAQASQAEQMPGNINTAQSAPQKADTAETGSLVTQVSLQSVPDTTYSTVEGITLADLLNNFVPYGKYATEMVFSTSGSNPSYSESFAPSDYDDAMLLWSAIETGQSKSVISGFMSALNSGAPEYWLEDAAVLTVTQPIISITFATQPSSALIDLRDENGNRVSPSSGNAKIYNLVQGERYTYTVAATNYTSQSGVIEKDAQPGTISITLKSPNPGDPGSGTNHTITGYTGTLGKVTPDMSTAKSGDLVTLTVSPAKDYGLVFLSASNTAIQQKVSCNTETYTFLMPDNDVTISATFSPIVFTINKRDGKNGPLIKAAVFTKEELSAEADTNNNGWAYLFAQDSIWRAIVATKLVTLDSLFKAAGITSYEWKKNSYLAFKCDDGVYDKSYPYYENINACQYYYTSGTQDYVPPGIAITWDSGSLADYTVSEIADRARDSTRLRFVYGISQEQYTNKNAAGARSPFGVLEMTVVYNDVPPTGSVGTEHDGSTTINENGTPLGETPYESVVIDATVTESKDSAGNITAKAIVESGVIEEALKELSEGFVIEVDAVSAAGNAVSAEVVFPLAGIKAAAENKTGIVIVSDFGFIHFDHEALEGMISASSGSGNITISIANVTGVNDSGMNDAQKATAGTNTVIRLEAKDTSGKSVANFGSGKATITIDYVRKNLNAIVDVSRISADGGTTDMNAVFSNNKIKWSTGTFSFYIITEELIMSFTDVSVGDWFYEAVEFVFKRGLFSGVTETTFAPGTTMTRAMLVTVLYRLEGLPSVTGGTGVFSDVTDTGAYYYSAVLWASQNGIVNGYPGGSFGVNDPITREQMVAILYRYTQYKGYDDTVAGTLAAYADAGSISGWALDAMTWAVTSGIITGMSSTEISPDGNTTRAQVATILQRCIENIFE